MRDSKGPSKTIGYAVVDGIDGTFRGALLVTDYRGIPVDFRYTDPITPSKIEKILYGNALDVYIKEELILESLVGGAEASPALWICKDPSLMASLADLVKTKVVVLSSSGRAPLDATGDMEKQNDPATYIVQADGVSAPLRFTLPAANAREEDGRAVTDILVEAAATMDLLEPFSRMNRAMDALEEEKVGP